MRIILKYYQEINVLNYMMIIFFMIYTTLFSSFMKFDVMYNTSSVTNIIE